MRILALGLRCRRVLAADANIVCVYWNYTFVTTLFSPVSLSIGFNHTDLSTYTMII
jgi:hypothetical protein